MVPASAERSTLRFCPGKCIIPVSPVQSSGFLFTQHVVCTGKHRGSQDPGEPPSDFVSRRFVVCTGSPCVIGRIDRLGERGSFQFFLGKQPCTRKHCGLQDPGELSSDFDSCDVSGFVVTRPSLVIGRADGLEELGSHLLVGLSDLLKK